MLIRLMPCRMTLNTCFTARSHVRVSRPLSLVPQIDGRDLWKYLSEGKNTPPGEANINFNFAAGPGFMSAATHSLLNEDGSHVEAVIATYNGTEYKLCRNCVGFTGVSLSQFFYTLKRLQRDVTCATSACTARSQNAPGFTADAPPNAYYVSLDRNSI